MKTGEEIAEKIIEGLNGEFEIGRNEPTSMWGPTPVVKYKDKVIAGVELNVIDLMNIPEMTEEEAEAELILIITHEIFRNCFVNKIWIYEE